MLSGIDNGYPRQYKSSMGLRDAAPQKLARTLVAILAPALLFAPTSRAQVVTATLTGTVTDSSGAMVPEAVVTATEMATGVSRSTTTSGEGVYTLPFLAPGTYRVEIQKAGFKIFAEANLTLDVSTVGRLNATLTPGSQTETVQVTAESALLQVESAEVAKNFETTSVTQLPIPDRSAQAIAGLMAGVSQPQLYSSGSGILENGGFTYMFNANGQVLGANNTMVDGIDNMDMALGLTLYQPAAEDVAEVHVATNAYSAEFGKVGGAVVNIVTRGGTNQFHGSLFEFNKTAALAARSLFAQAPLPKPGLRNNDFGGAGGGPIRKNKTFFYGSYEGRRLYSNSTTTTTTAQPAWLKGDFSAVPSLRLYDPFTGNPDGTGRTPVPNNMLPASEISPITQKLLQYIQAPNLTTVGAAAFTLNYVYQAPTTYSSNSYDVRIDHTFNERAKAYAKFDMLPNHVFEGTIYTGTGAGNDLTSDNYSITGSLGFTYAFSPNMLMELRANYNRWKAHIKCTDTVTNKSLGIFDPNPDQISTQSLASIGGIGISGFGQSYECPTIDNDNVFPFSASFTKSMGKHSLKWGGDFVRYRNDRFQVQGSGGFGGRGTFTFGPTITQLYQGAAGGSPLGPYGSVVNAFADFMFGLPDSTDRAQILLSPTMRQSHLDGYIQDSYKITPSLTLDIGVRYDFYEAVKVRYAGGASNYDPSTNSLLIAGYGNIGLSDGVNSKPGYIAPRLGIAYSLGAKTAIRAGYGISYWEQRFGWTGGTLNQQYPVIYNVQNGNTGDYRVDGTFSSIPAVQYFAVPQNGILNPAPNQAFYTMPSHYNLPAVYNWNFTIQRQIASTFIVDAGWVANLGRELPYAYNINQGLPGAGPNAEVLNLEYGRTASTTIRAYGVNSSYNSLQVNATKRWSRGYHVTLAYAFAKSLDTNGENGGFLDPNNYKRTWGPSSFDQTQLLTISHVYELPFGKGRPFLNHGIAGAIVGNWQLSGVFRYYSGTPFTPTAPATNCNCAGGTAYADVTGTPVYPGGEGPGQLWISPSAFALPAVNTHGNAGRDVLRGPGSTNYDANIVRKFRVREKATLEFRMEATNALNHPHFGNPASTVGSATFGQITTATGPRQAQAALRVSF